MWQRCHCIGTAPRGGCSQGRVESEVGSRVGLWFLRPPEQSCLVEANISAELRSRCPKSLANATTRHFIIIEIRNNRDSWDSPLDARIRGLPLVHRHCPTRMGNPCMRGLLLHSPRHQQQQPRLRRGAALRLASASDAGGNSAAAPACRDSPCAWGNAGARWSPRLCTSRGEPPRSPSSATSV